MLPEHGVLHPAPQKKFRETVVLVPYYGAHANALNRHIDLLGELGYDCVTLSLKDDIRDMPQHLISSVRQFGLKHIWADQIENVLNALPGNKILFGFSNPSASALEVVARRHGGDIKGVVCDGGPSSQLWHSMINYFTFEKNIPFYPLKASMATLFTMLWHPRFLKVIQEDLQKFPKGFRVLSIRGWKDPLITPQMIDQIFESAPQIDWQKLSLPQAAHLNGLKDFREDYVPSVTQFLSQISSKI